MQMQNDRELIAALFQRYSGLMYDIAFSILHQQQNAEDAVQETMLKVIRHIAQFRTLPDANIRALLTVMTRNTAISQRRRLIRLISFDMNDEAVQSGLAMQQSDDDAYARRMLAEQIRRLPAEEQALLRMKYWEQLSHREIGRQLGISEDAVSARLRRLRKKLKTILESEGDMHDGPTV